MPSIASVTMSASGSTKLVTKPYDQERELTKPMRKSRRGKRVRFGDNTEKKAPSSHVLLIEDIWYSQKELAVQLDEDLEACLKVADDATATNDMNGICSRGLEEFFPCNKHRQEERARYVKAMIHKMHQFKRIMEVTNQMRGQKEQCIAKKLQKIAAEYNEKTTALALGTAARDEAAARIIHKEQQQQATKTSTKRRILPKKLRVFRPRGIVAKSA